MFCVVLVEGCAVLTVTEGVKSLIFRIWASLSVKPPMPRHFGEPEVFSRASVRGLTIKDLTPLPPLAFRNLCMSLGILLTGCTGFQEAWTEQSGNLSYIPQKVRLVCNNLTDAGRKAETQAVEPSTHESHLGIRQVKDSRPNKDRIGRMFSWGPPGGVLTGRTNWSIDIILETEVVPEQILLKDIVKILERNRFVVEYGPNQKANPPVSLDVEFLNAKVQSYPAGWTELQGKIVGDVIFRVTLIESETQKVLWRTDFPAEETIKVSYFLKRYHEEALNKAYCHALDLFEKAVRTHTFTLAAQGGGGPLR